MAASITINGISLADLSVYVSTIAGFNDASERAIQTTPLLGQMGVLAGPPIAFGPRTLTLTGTIDPSARTVDALFTAINILRDLCYSGALDLTLTDSSDNVRRVTGAQLTRFQASPRLGAEHVQANTVADWSITLLCPDPTWEDLEPTLVAMPTANTRYPVALGTAPARFKFRAMGASPALTYRTAGGDTVWTLTQTQAVTGTEDWFDFDATTCRIWFYDNGVKADAIMTLTGGNQDWGRAALDPQDGDYATSQWPTVSCNVAAEILYWKRWL
ncbi:MAG: hypothetical protein IT352_07525 [Gemmatimonadales bacterium]|nr:hypothetical protein [Gemmatimonadales bacterium]